MGIPELSAETIERYVRIGAWQKRSLHQIVDEAAAAAPDREAMCDQTRRLTYRQLVEQSRRLAAFLLGAGLRSGDPVALQSPNRVEILVTHLACSRADLTFVPISNAWRQREVTHLLAMAKANVVIVPPPEKGYDFLAETERMRGELADLRLVGTLDGGGDFSFWKIPDAAPAHPVPTDPNIPRFVMVTSGTTGLPKASLWSDNNLWYFGRCWGDATACSFKDRALGLAPANTGSVGYVYAVLFPVMKGATSILLERWDPAGALRVMEQEQPTMLTAVPTQIIKLVQEPAIRSTSVPSLRVVSNGGAPLPSENARAFEGALNCRVQTVYGATDGGVPVMTRIDDPPAKRLGTVGRGLPQTEIRLVDAQVRDVPAGEAGELIWRGPTKSFGYLNEPARTEETFVDGFYRSGDLAEVDNDGYYRIVGRSKDLIIRGGQNISPREVEEAVGSHGAVAEVAAVGIPDAVYGERVCAVVALRGDAKLTFEELVAFLKGQQMAIYKLPERLEIFDELPKNAAGKISKADVKQMVLARIAAAS